MYKKITVLFLLVVIFLNGFPILPYANESEEIEKIENLLNDEENFIITESSDNSEGEKLIDESDLENARKVYFSESLMLTAYEENPSVDSIISEQYQWCVASEGTSEYVSVFTVEDGKARLSGVRPSVGYYVSDDEIMNILSEYGVESSEILSIKYVYSAVYHTVFNIVETESEILCIPFSSNEEYFGFENKKVFIFEDLMKSMIKRFDESELADSDPYSVGGVPLRKNYTPLIVTVLILAAVTVSVVFIIRRRRYS